LGDRAKPVSGLFARTKTTESIDEMRMANSRYGCLAHYLFGGSLDLQIVSARFTAFSEDTERASVFGSRCLKNEYREVAAFWREPRCDTEIYRSAEELRVFLELVELI